MIPLLSLLQKTFLSDLIEEIDLIRFNGQRLDDGGLRPKKCILICAEKDRLTRIINIQ